MPLTNEEHTLLLDIAEGMKDSVPCTSCRYCCAGCPMGLDIPMLLSTYNDIRFAPVLTLQRLKHVGFLCTFTSKYTRKYIRLMNFYKTFTTKDTFVSINDSIRLVSKPIYMFSFKLQYYLNFYVLSTYLLLNYEVDRSYQIFHYIYQYQNSLNCLLHSL